MTMENIVVKKTGEANIVFKKLTADEGMYITNGEVYGKQICLGKTDAVGKWWDITEEESQEIIEKQNGGEENA